MSDPLDFANWAKLRGVEAFVTAMIEMQIDEEVWVRLMSLRSSQQAWTAAGRFWSVPFTMPPNS